MREVVTLQFGQQANYLGTHYWNTQESYFTYPGEEESPVDHDVSFRPGMGADGSETYTPRTVIYDLKGAFGTLRRENALYQLQQQENPSQQGQWSGRTIPLQLSPIAPSSYQQALDQGLEPPVLTNETVRFWSDYNHVFYHPRSIVQLNEYELNSSLMPFERFQTGEELFANLDREHDLLDRDLRPFLEECDQLQGIQIFSSTDDAWGGFTSRYLERISDELGKGCRWVFGLQHTQRTSRERQALQMSNVAQSIYGIDQSASMHIPLASLPSSLPSYAVIDGTSKWNTSALQAAAAESMTLPTRLRSAQGARATFDDLESTLNGDGMRRIAACALSVQDAAQLEDDAQTNGHSDDRITNGYHVEDEVEDKEPEGDIDLFPELTTQSVRGQQRRRTHLFSKMQSLRGPWKTTTELEESDARLHDRFSASRARTSRHQSALLFPVLSSYPKIFQLQSNPHKLAINATLSTSTAIADRIRSIVGVARRMVGIDEREALCDGLTTMAEEYEEGWDSDDASDDGD
ncbi:related to DML1 [Lecanosticta acicola]|uniref:Related to DML1 n=1 Tax=Lecanosticta acicola TaxID=111012 RepID=A0AAI8YRY5_9PEZI|nr:related to DML1 [Lecanosticta acicola]